MLSLKEINDIAADEACDDGLHIQNSTLFKEFLEERSEIMKHKWLESEKAGYDIGFDRALTDWRIKYRSKWIEARLKKHQPRQEQTAKNN